MDNKSKLFLAFGAGALIGAGLAVIFTTDEGKAIVEKAKSHADKFAEELKEKLADFENEVAEFLKNNEPKENAGA